MDVERNPTMFGGNRFKLAVFGSNCSSGRAATTVPERWQNTFEDNIRLAQLADAAGIEAMVPIGRWKGYGGATDFEGSTFETITWACGLLAATQRLTVFGTVHVPLFPPVLAAKQIVAASASTLSVAGTKRSSTCLGSRRTHMTTATLAARNGSRSSSVSGQRRRRSITPAATTGSRASRAGRGLGVGGGPS